MNATDDRRLRQRLREEFGALEVSPAPVPRVTARGRGIRARRRTLAFGSIVLAAAGVALSAHVTGGQQAARPPVTVSVPDPAAPGWVFASGTADGKPWQLAVRNIALRPGTRWCLPAVMLNGRDADVLFKADPNPSYGNPAFLTHIPGFPGLSAVFTQVAPDVTRLVATFPGGRQVSVRPVWVSACAQRFHLAGFAYARAPNSISELSTYSKSRLDDGLAIAPSDLSPARPASAGVWVNLDTSRVDIATSRSANPIGAGTVNGQTWHIRTSLGLFGQCYTATLRTPGHGRGQSSECVPVAAPPRVAALSPMTISDATTALPGYAGLVNPRAAKVEVALSDGTIPPARTVTVAGRTYVAFAIPPGCQVLQLKLFDSAGHVFAITTDVPPAA